MQSFSAPSCRSACWQITQTCGRQRRGCWGTAWGVLEAAGSLCHSPSAGTLGSCQPCRSLGPNSTGIYNRSYSRQMSCYWILWSNQPTAAAGDAHEALLVHRVVKLSNSLMSPVFTQLRQNVTKHVWSLGGKKKQISRYHPQCFKQDVNISKSTYFVMVPSMSEMMTLSSQLHR